MSQHLSAEDNNAGDGKQVATVRAQFEAAHFLPNTPSEHKCHRLHGHSYVVALRIDAQALPVAAPALRSLIARLEHCCLNEIEGLQNPTSELLACWLWERLPQRGLCEIRIGENDDSCCVYRGE